MNTNIKEFWHLLGIHRCPSHSIIEDKKIKNNYLVLKLSWCSLDCPFCWNASNQVMIWYAVMDIKNLCIDGKIPVSWFQPYQWWGSLPSSLARNQPCKWRRKLFHEEMYRWLNTSFLVHLSKTRNETFLLWWKVNLSRYKIGINKLQWYYMRMYKLKATGYHTFVNIIE